MAKVISTVILRDTSGNVVVLRPGDTVPRWADVSNPAAVEKTKPKTSKES